MSPGNHDDDISPLTDAITSPVQVLTDAVRIRDMLVARPAVAEYLRALDPDKWERALQHVIDVGLAEILSRRRGFSRE